MIEEVAVGTIVLAIGGVSGVPWRNRRAIRQRLCRHNW
jgi:hypothetical protein